MVTMHDQWMHSAVPAPWSLKDKWETEWGLTKPAHQRHQPKRAKEHGHLLAQNCKAKGTFSEILRLLRVDNAGTFLFDSREALLEKGTNRVREHFARFGLKMRIGHEGGKSKTEAMCISPSPKEDEEKILEPSLEPRIPVHDGFITLTEDFRHLGSIISSNLQGKLEITTRIRKASAQIGALRVFFRCHHIQLSTKRRGSLHCNPRQRRPLGMQFLGIDRKNAEKVESLLSQEHSLDSQHKHS